jgi:hypothetical protein
MIKDETRTKFYVAITRARFSVAIIMDFKSNETFNNIKKYSNIPIGNNNAEHQ